MQYSNAKKLYKRNAAEWNLCIFFETANEALGYISLATYKLLKGTLPSSSDSNKYIYMPEEELLDRIRDDDVIIDFNWTFDDSMTHQSENIPWLEKIRFRLLLEKQTDLNPANLEVATDVYFFRQELLKRWFLCFQPYLENFELCRFPQTPLIVENWAAHIKHSADLLISDETDAHKDDLIFIRTEIEKHIFMR